MAGLATRVAIGGGVAVALLAPALQLGIGAINPIAGAAAYLLVLTAFGIAFWAFFRLTPSEFGWRWGRLSDYAIALFYPAVVISALAGAAILRGGGTPLGEIDWADLAHDIALMGSTGIIAGLISEEGFFRGALWGLGARAKWPPMAILGWTSVAFLLWHLPVPLIDPDYQIPRALLPIYFANAFLLAIAWGILRMASGSVLVCALAHSVWNAFAYQMFGYGDAAGDLAIADFGTYGPERGLYGLGANVLVVIALAIWARGRMRAAP